MHPAISVVYDQKRGCGWRKGGGTYLMGGSAFSACGKLPLPLDGICECCGSPVIPQREMKGGGIDYLLPRTLRKFDAARLFGAVTCKDESAACNGCLINHTATGYLIGVGTKNYSPTSFLEEAGRLGLSKRIAQIPREFKVGESVVFLAHREVVPRVKVVEEAHEVETVLHSGEGGEGGVGSALIPEKTETVMVPGVFCIFIPDRIEYVVRGDESDDEIERLLERGITPVMVKRVDAQGQLLPATWAEAQSDVEKLAVALVAALKECPNLDSALQEGKAFLANVGDKYGLSQNVLGREWRGRFDDAVVQARNGTADDPAQKFTALVSIWFKESEAENGDDEGGEL